MGSTLAARGPHVSAIEGQPALHVADQGSVAPTLAIVGKGPR